MRNQEARRLVSFCGDPSVESVTTEVKVINRINAISYFVTRRVLSLYRRGVAVQKAQHEGKANRELNFQNSRKSHQGLSLVVFSSPQNMGSAMQSRQSKTRPLDAFFVEIIEVHAT